MRNDIAQECKSAEVLVVQEAEVLRPADVEVPDERSYHQQRDRHWTMLWISTFVVAASFLLRSEGAEKVALHWPHFQLPEMCASRSVFGVECPGCGLTRSFIALASGDLSSSFHFHRLGWLLAISVVAQFPYRAYSLSQLHRRIYTNRWSSWFAWFLITALILNWVIKLCGY